MKGIFIKNKSLVAALVLIVAATGCGHGAKDLVGKVGRKVEGGAAKVEAKLHTHRNTEPVTVRVMTVCCSEDVAASMLVGTIEPAKSSVVTSGYPGRLKSIKVRKGQNVKASAVIAEIDAQSVNSAYEAAKAVYDQTVDALKRIEQVYGTGSISEARLLEVKTEVAKARATYLSAEKAKKDCIIRAPYSGVIGEIYPHEGMDIGAMAPVAQLLDVGTLEAHASVPENEYALYDAGMPVRIEVPAAGAVSDGVLAVKGIEASSLTRSYDCTFKFTKPAASGIMPGMLCKVYLTGACRNAIVIPSSAVMVDEGGRYVWCCNEGTASKKYIICNGFSGNGVIVTEGLDEGDLLVIEGSRKISNGMSGIRTIEE